MSENGWIDVREKLPADFEKALVVDTEGYRFIGYWDGDAWKRDGDRMDFITHWQPLPAPPIVPAPELVCPICLPHEQSSCPTRHAVPEVR